MTGILEQLITRLDALTERVAALEKFTGLKITDWKDGERYRFVGGTKVYRSYADYVDD